MQTASQNMVFAYIFNKIVNGDFIGYLHQGQRVNGKVVPDHIHYNWDTENIHHMLDD